MLDMVREDRILCKWIEGDTQHRLRSVTSLLKRMCL